MSMQSGWSFSGHREYELEAIAQSLQEASIVYNAYAVQNGIQTISFVLQNQDPSNGFVEKSKQTCF